MQYLSAYVYIISDTGLMCDGWWRLLFLDETRKMMLTMLILIMMFKVIRCFRYCSGIRCLFQPSEAPAHSQPCCTGTCLFEYKNDWQKEFEKTVLTRNVDLWFRKANDKKEVFSQKKPWSKKQILDQKRRWLKRSILIRKALIIYYMKNRTLIRKTVLIEKEGLW